MRASSDRRLGLQGFFAKQSVVVFEILVRLSRSYFSFDTATAVLAAPLPPPMYSIYAVKLLGTEYIVVHASGWRRGFAL